MMNARLWLNCASVCLGKAKHLDAALSYAPYSVRSGQRNTDVNLRRVDIMPPREMG